MAENLTRWETPVSNVSHPTVLHSLGIDELTLTVSADSAQFSASVPLFFGVRATLEEFPWQGPSGFVGTTAIVENSEWLKAYSTCQELFSFVFGTSCTHFVIFGSNVTLEVIAPHPPSWNTST